MLNLGNWRGGGGWKRKEVGYIYIFLYIYIKKGLFNYCIKCSKSQEQVELMSRGCLWRGFTVCNGREVELGLVCGGIGWVIILNLPSYDRWE